MKARRSKKASLKSWLPNLFSGRRKNTAVRGGAGCAEGSLGEGAEQEMGLSRSPGFRLCGLKSPCSGLPSCHCVTTPWTRITGCGHKGPFPSDTCFRLWFPVLAATSSSAGMGSPQKP